MKKEKTTTRRQRQTKNATGEGGRMKMYSLMVVCFLVVACGFFFAARQHFSSVDYGMRNSKLRKQADDLEAEKKRLLFEREVALSPSEIKKAAKKIGVGDFDADSIQLASAKTELKPVATQKVSPAKPNEAVNAFIAKTALVSSTARPRFADIPKIERADKEKKAGSDTARLLARR